jgi:hypothetical protein
MSEVIRLAGSNPLVQRLLKALPYAGDVTAGLLELANQDEPDEIQRLKNAAVVGGGGALASTATFGMDFIPQVLEAVGNYAADREATGEVEFVDPYPGLHQLIKAAPAFNPENYLRNLAYGGEHPESQEAIEKGFEEAGVLLEEARKAGARPATLIMPPRF